MPSLNNTCSTSRARTHAACCMYEMRGPRATALEEAGHRYLDPHAEAATRTRVPSDWPASGSEASAERREMLKRVSRGRCECRADVARGDTRVASRRCTTEPAEAHPARQLSEPITTASPIPKLASTETEAMHNLLWPAPVRRRPGEGGGPPRYKPSTSSQPCCDIIALLYYQSWVRYARTLSLRG